MRVTSLFQKPSLPLFTAIFAYTLVTVLASPAAAKITNAPNAPKTPINVETIATGLQNPWALQFLPDGRMLVTERPGRLRVVSASGQLMPPITGLPKVAVEGQGGLLDLRLAADFADSKTIFFSYTEPRAGKKNSTTVARANLMLEGETGRLENVKVIFRQKTPTRGGLHFGSRIVIAKDGTLFITTGDRGSRSADVQVPGTHVGKIIRVNPDGSNPKDNPSASGGAFKSWAPQVWSMGHRNIQGAVLDPKSGQLWTVEHGAMGGDELNNPQKGKNYGWPVISYGLHYSGKKIGVGHKKSGMEQPVYYWDPSIAVSGLALYTGKLFETWQGDLLLGALGGAHMVRLQMKDGQVIAQEKLLADKLQRIRDIRIGPDGAVYALTDHHETGSIIRLTPTQ